MKRLALAVAAVLTLGLAWRYRCLGRHRVQRHPLGGYRCIDCSRVFTDLVEAGVMDGSAYVDPLRRGAVQHGVERIAR